MSLMELGRQLLEATPDEVTALFESLDADEVRAVQAAIDAADLEEWRAGRQNEELRQEAEKDPITWVTTLFPSYARAGFAPHMTEFWDWVWAIRRGERPPPFIGVWFRGGTKSTSAELASIMLGAFGRRGYGLYCSDTQDQGDEHVGNIGAMLESPRFAALYPEMASRAVGQYGTSKGWSRKRLHTAAGFVIDALGVATNVRGIRVEEQRPDFIILDDIDSDFDGPATVDRKIDLITKKLLPAGTPDLAVLGIQNLVHPNSIFARLANLTDEPADFLIDRHLSGPIKAVENLDLRREDDGRYVVVGGTPTWEGYPLAAFQAAIDNEGYTAAMQERQHEVEPAAGGLFSDLIYAHCRPDEVPALLHRTLWCDPAISHNDGSDCQALQVDGMDERNIIYRLWSWEAKASPQEALTLAVRMAIEFGVPLVGVETDQGGETWESVFREACTTVRARYCGTCWAYFPGEDEAVADADREEHFRVMGAEGEIHGPYEGGMPGFTSDKAGAGYGPKVHRASQMLADYQRPGRIIHVLGSHKTLEAALRRFPKVKPFDLTDAAFWSWNWLNKRRGRASTTVARQQVPKAAPSGARTEGSGRVTPRPSPRVSQLPRIGLGRTGVTPTR